MRRKFTNRKKPVAVDDEPSEPNTTTDSIDVQPANTVDEVNKTDDAKNTDEDGEFEVENVVDKRFINGKIVNAILTNNVKLIWEFFGRMQPQYLIKYKGYPDTENTWEPLDNLSCSKLIRQFEHRSTKRRSSIRAIPPVQTYFEYESIMDKRIINGIVEYLVKWKQSEETSWTPEQDIVSKAALEEYERKLMEATATLAASASLNGETHIKIEPNPSTTEAVVKLETENGLENTVKTETKHQRDFAIKSEQLETANGQQNDSHSDSDTIMQDEVPYEVMPSDETPDQPAMATSEDSPNSPNSPTSRQEEGGQQLMLQRHQQLLELLEDSDESMQDEHHKQPQPIEQTVHNEGPSIAIDFNQPNAPLEASPAEPVIQPQSKRRKTVHATEPTIDNVHNHLVKSEATAAQLELYQKLVDGKAEESDMEVIDLVRILATDICKCLVKMDENKAWVPFETVKNFYPIPLIKYYETRIQWSRPKKIAS